MPPKKGPAQEAERAIADLQAKIEHFEARADSWPGNPRAYERGLEALRAMEELLVRLRELGQVEWVVELAGACESAVKTFEREMGAAPASGSSGPPD